MSGPAPRPLKIGLIQMQARERLEQNLARAEELARQAALAGAGIICLQELFRTRYFCQKEDAACFDLAETVPGPSSEHFGRLAQELEAVIIVPLFEKRTAGIYHNSALVLGPDGAILGHYRKMHIPDDPLYYEKFYFTPGDLGFGAHRTPRGTVGVLVCWDQWFPEAARLTALQGAEIIFYPTAIGWLAGESEEVNRDQHSAWETVQRGHAVANGVFVAAVNRVGKEGDLTFWGQSFVADPMGRVLGRAGSAGEEVLVVECDLARVEETRRGWPFLRDRRVDAYQKIDRRFIDDTEQP